jgi:hypothetical protein
MGLRQHPENPSPGRSDGVSLPFSSNYHLPAPTWYCQPLPEPRCTTGPGTSGRYSYLPPGQPAARILLLRQRMLGQFILCHVNQTCFSCYSQDYTHSGLENLLQLEQLFCQHQGHPNDWSGMRERLRPERTAPHEVVFGPESRSGSMLQLGDRAVEGELDDVGGCGERCPRTCGDVQARFVLAPVVQRDVFVGDGACGGGAQVQQEAAVLAHPVDQGVQDLLKRDVAEVGRVGPVA